jgi:hypothetical protein
MQEQVEESENSVVPDENNNVPVLEEDQEAHADEVHPNLLTRLSQSLRARHAFDLQRVTPSFFLLITSLHPL